MKKKIVRMLTTLATTTLCMFGIIGCAGTASDAAATTGTSATVAEAQSTAEAKTNLSGTISLAGSTSMEKVCEALMEGFMEKYPRITVTTEYTGSGAGLESLAAGSVDIGNSSRHVKDSEISAGAVENVIALDGIAVITDARNTVADLTKDELADIYTGKIKSWSELGGANEAIVVIGRENGSGTRSAFEELLKVQDACNYAQELDSTGAVLAKVAATPGSIGYVSLDVVDGSVQAVKLDGVEASEGNIIAGKYILSRPFVMATKGEISGQNDLVKLWFEYVASDEGSKIISDLGLILPQ